MAKRKVYTEATKQKVLAAVKARGDRPVSAIAKEHGVSDHSIWKWLRKEKKAPLRHYTKAPVLASKTDNELGKLQAENQVLEARQHTPARASQPTDVMRKRAPKKLYVLFDRDGEAANFSVDYAEMESDAWGPRFDSFSIRVYTLQPKASKPKAKRAK